MVKYFIRVQCGLELFSQTVKHKLTQLQFLCRFLSCASSSSSFEHPAKRIRQQSNAANLQELQMLYLLNRKSIRTKKAQTFLPAILQERLPMQTGPVAHILLALRATSDDGRESGLLSRHRIPELKTQSYKRSLLSDRTR